MEPEEMAAAIDGLASFAEETGRVLAGHKGALQRGDRNDHYASHAASLIGGRGSSRCLDLQPGSGAFVSGILHRRQRFIEWRAALRKSDTVSDSKASASSRE